MGDRVQAGPEAGADDKAKHDAPFGEGVTAIRWLLGKGQPDPRYAVEVLLMYPRDAAAIIAYLTGTLGNAYVMEVMNLWSGAAPKPPAGVVADETTKQSVGSGTATGTTTAAAAATGDKYSDLLARAHAGTRGADGSAAWLLAAMDLGLVSVAGGKLHADTKTQLEDFAADKELIRSLEKSPAPEKDESEAHAKKRGVHKVKDGVYDIERNPAAAFFSCCYLLDNNNFLLVVSCVFEFDFWFL